MDEHKQHVFALGLVAVIGMGALIMMFSANSIGHATLIKSQPTPFGGCNQGEVLVSPRTVTAVGRAGREAYGSDFSAYRDAGCWYRVRTGYCCQESYLKELLG